MLPLVIHHFKTRQITFPFVANRSGDCGSLWQAAVEMALSGPRKVDEAITNVWQVDKGGTLVLVSAIAPFLFLVLTRRDLGFDD